MASYDGEEYRVTRCIGQGAFGKVYLLKNSIGDKVALKVVELAGKDPKVVELTLQEIYLLAQLRHEHILKFLDSKKDGSALLILTEFCRNGDLSGYISNHRGEKMDERRLVEWVRQIANALEYLHNLPKPVIHRDLKSPNVFLDANWDTRLGDFGLSRVIESSTDIATSLVGTPLYMAPEMFSRYSYTEKTDIFSLSILMYEMATMDNDFFKNLVSQKQSWNVHHQVPTMPYGYSAGVTDLMKMMMQADPNKRPAADEILRQNVFKTTRKPSPITDHPKEFDMEDDDDDDKDTYLSSDTLTWVNLSIESGASVGGRPKPVGRSKQEKSAKMLLSGRALAAPPETFHGSSIATEIRELGHLLSKSMGRKVYGQETGRDVWAQLEDFHCPSEHCPSKKPLKWHCSEDDQPLFLSQRGVIKCKSEDHRGDVCHWGWNCGNEYHQEKFFRANLEGVTLALSKSVQLIGRMGSAWVAELINSIGKQNDP